MTAETITDTIRHIFRFFVPPLVNLLLLSIIIGESLGVGPYLRDFVTSIRDLLSSYVHTSSEVISSTAKSLLPNLKTEDIERLNPAVIAQTIISDLGSATTYVSFISTLFFIFVSFVVDGITLTVSRLLQWLDHIIASFIDKHIYRRFDFNTPIVGKLLGSDAIREQPSVPEQKAREVFGSPERDPLSRDDLWRISRAWLSKNAKESFWLSEHDTAYANTLNWKLSVDYARVYAVLSVLLYLYTMLGHPSLKGILFPIALWAILALLRLCYLCSIWSLQEIDFREFYYCNVGFGSSKGAGAVEAA
jgi:hypothetical protein